MKIVSLICRILLGLIFVVFGANILHPFLPQPPMDPAAAATKFSVIMMESGWFKFIGFFQVLGGLLVLYPGTVPLGICILTPLTVNILIFHLTLAGGHGIAPGLVTALLELVLIYAYRSSFAGIITHKATHTAA
jgi:putative oxidoreductase